MLTVVHAQNVVCIVLVSLPGVVTAEMCQSKEDSDVMSKMVEQLDEVNDL